MLYKSIYPHPEAPIANCQSSKQEETPLILFPEEIQIIVRSDRQGYGNLYLGNLQAALNPNLLTNLKITSILSVAKGYCPSYPKELIRHHKYVPIQDSPHAQLHRSLHEGVDFITEQILVSNVLVHCVAGLSRSACFVIAYLMKNRKISFEEALYEVKSQRKMVRLNSSMQNQLKKYELDMQNQGGRRNKYGYSVRVNSNSNVSSIPQSYFKQDAVDDGSILAELYTQKDKIMEFDQSQNLQRKSQASNKHSVASRSNYAIKTDNPEDKVLSKSFRSKNSPQMHQAQPQFNFTKKRSSSRAEYEKKINLMDSRNLEINQALSAIQTKYDNELKASKLTFRNSASKADHFEEQATKLSPSLIFKGLLIQQ